MSDLFKIPDDILRATGSQPAESRSKVQVESSIGVDISLSRRGVRLESDVFAPRVTRDELPQVAASEYVTVDGRLAINIANQLRPVADTSLEELEQVPTESTPTGEREEPEVQPARGVVAENLPVEGCETIAQGELLEHWNGAEFESVGPA